MIQFFTKKLVLVVAVFALLGTISCQKEINESIDGTEDNTTPPTRTFDPTTRINSSVTGFVTDENNTVRHVFNDYPLEQCYISIIQIC